MMNQTKMIRYLIRQFTTTNSISNKMKLPPKNKMPPRPKIVEDEIEEKFIKGGSGKGGQKINKTNSKVQLFHKETGIVVTSQATRSREQNRKIAREILAQKLQDLKDPETSRSNILILKKQQAKQRRAKKSKKKYSNAVQQEENATEDEEQEFIRKMLEQNSS